ncbi:hypothetical protein Gorai_017102, partial [Gossypium raimondii]|nr:hypothetical protein [Gossypium raimondii]
MVLVLKSVHQLWRRVLLILMPQLRELLELMFPCHMQQILRGWLCHRLKILSVLQSEHATELYHWLLLH